MTEVQVMRSADHDPEVPTQFSPLHTYFWRFAHHAFEPTH
jgi:hypothetical protein